ncbi:MAG: DEAD/DEAH box helicase [Planctomycetes bacterium]|nr:DEAD/DEAH box helicase [Planctomycetota bacterium]MBI3843673.1 DEAD/DEAH box helicase [Planctomycetota bacterium]
MRCHLPADASEQHRLLFARYFEPVDGASLAEGRLRPNRLREFPRLLAAIRECDEPVAVHADLLEHVEGQIRRVDGLDREKALVARLDERGFLDDLLKLPLLPYQKRGVVFCAMRGRTLLADDMGLGKTAQAIGAAELMARERGIRRVLVICPASLKHQWESEIRRFTDRSCLVLSGGMRGRKRAYVEGSEFFHVVNYEAVLADAEFLRDVRYDLIVLDEAQRIKNWKTKTSRAVKSLRSPFCIVLTGTPLENRLEELYNIVQYVDERLLGPAFEFVNRHVLFDETLKTKATGYKGLDVLRERLKPICLRRKKHEVLPELPPRTDKNFYVEITPAQRDAYASQARIVAGLLQQWRRRGFLTEMQQQRLMMALANMRMICNSLYLFDKTTRGEEPKLDEFSRIVEDLVFGLKEKVVVFSQWEGTHRLIEPRLQKLGIGYGLLCGNVRVAARGRLIQSFRDDPKMQVFLSTDAGGVGLNLQAASTVVSVEIPWNPAVLNQRVGRVHRLGQRRAVSAFNLLAKNTIEEHIWGVLGFKQALFDGVFDGISNEVVMRPKGQNRFLTAVEELLQKDRTLVPDDAPVHVPSPAAVATAVQVAEPAAPAESFGGPLLQLLGTLAQAFASPAGAGGSPPALRVTKEAGTGEPLLALSLADRSKLRDTIGQLAGALAQLAKNM